MITSSSPRLECPSAVTGCRPVAYYMLGTLCLYITLCSTTENPTLWMYVWCVIYLLLWLCCNTAIVVAHFICCLSIFLFHDTHTVDSTNRCTPSTCFTCAIRIHQHVSWSTTTINGNNGEWTNTDDLDHAARVRMNREASNRRHAVNPGVGNRGRVRNGPPLPRPEGVAPPPVEPNDDDVDDDEPISVDIGEVQVTLYSRGVPYIPSGILARVLRALWLTFKTSTYIGALVFVIYQLHVTREPVYNLPLVLLILLGCYYLLRKTPTDYFVGSVAGDLTTWGTTEVTLVGVTKVGERTHGYLPGLNYNEKYTETASMMFLNTLRRKHPGINCHAEMVNICLNTIQHVHPDEYTMYYQIANNTALYYYQERMRYSVRANRVVVNGRNLLGSA